MINMKIRCFVCNKKMDARDAFHLDLAELVNPFSIKNIANIGKDLCLKCYLKTKNRGDTLCTINPQARTL